MVELTFNKEPALASMAQFRKSFESNLQTVGKWAGRVIAHRMHTWTQPISQGQGDMFPVKRMQERIARDVKLMYPSWDDTNWFSGVYRMIRAERGEPEAKKWWSQYKREEAGYFDPEESFDPVTGDYRASGKDARSVAQTRGFIKSRKRDDARYRARRKAEAAPGSFDVRTDPIAMVKSRKSALKAQQMRAGMAKAAWKQAADAFGPTKNTGRGSFKMKWDRRVNPVNNATGGVVGSGSLSFNGSVLNITIHNRIRYADEAIESAHYERALDDSDKQIKMVLELRLRAAFRNAFKQSKAGAASRESLTFSAA